MSTFDGEDLFGSGPHRFHVGGLSLRHVLNETPGSRGIQLSHLGHHGRSISQVGDLIADDPGQMQALLSAIEAKLDGKIHTLIDDVGRAWMNTVMLSLDLKPMTRVGIRWQNPYSIQYIQTMP